MPYARLSKSEITPRSEDAGLFKNDICRLNVELCPIMQRNRRQDVMVTGYSDRNVVITVLFAGRRLADAAPLLASLKTLREAAIVQARRNGMPFPENTVIRMPVQIEGAWRRRLDTDDDGFAHRSYQLIAARWIVVDANGKSASFGAAAVLS